MFDDGPFSSPRPCYLPRAPLARLHAPPDMRPVCPGTDERPWSAPRPSPPALAAQIGPRRMAREVGEQRTPVCSVAKQGEEEGFEAKASGFKLYRV